MSQVRISDGTYEILRVLSLTENKPMQEIVDKAVEDYRKNAFLKGLAEDYRRLQADADALKEYKSEMDLWDDTLSDGLNEE